MRIMITANSAWNVWNFRRPLIEAFMADGHRVMVFAPADETVPRIRAMGCAFRPLPMDPKGVNPVEGLALVVRFLGAIREEQPDVILSFTIKNNIFGAMAAKLAGIAFIPNVTGLGTAFLSGGMVRRFAEMLYRRAFRSLPVVFFQNPDDSSLFVSRGLVDEVQVRHVPGSGVEIDRFVPTPLPDLAQGTVFLMISRLLRDKGVYEFVEAARKVKECRPNVRFRILGAIVADNRSAVPRTTVEEWVAEGCIEYLGTTQDVRPYILNAHCVVLPSYREGVPRTLIEAAAMARPVIATDVPGCRQVVEDGINGLLCQPRDPVSLATAILSFLDSGEEEWESMGRAGRRKMERDFDVKYVLAAYREAIDKVASVIKPER